jgi:uncharacterized protein (DUF924 family)
MILFIFFRSYFARKNSFEQEQVIDYLQKRKKFDEELRDDFKSVLEKAGYRSDDEWDSGPDEVRKQSLVLILSGCL